MQSKSKVLLVLLSVLFMYKFTTCSACISFFPHATDTIRTAVKKIPTVSEKSSTAADSLYFGKTSKEPVQSEDKKELISPHKLGDNYLYYRVAGVFETMLTAAGNAD